MKASHSLITCLLLLLGLFRDARCMRLPSIPEFSWRSSKGCSDFQSKAQFGSVVLNSEGDFEFKSNRRQSGGDDDNSVAWGSFLDSAHTVSNFGQLRVNTSGAYSDSDQVFAAGYLEGYLTAQRIHENFRNLHHYFTTTMGADLEEPMKWIHEQDDWVRDQCHQLSSLKTTNDNDDEDDDDDDDDDNVSEERFWAAVCLAIKQFDGIIAGYTARYNDQEEEHKQHLILGKGPSKSDKDAELPYMSYEDFLFMESNGDLYDVIDSMDPTQRPSWAPGGEDPTFLERKYANDSSSSSSSLKEEEEQQGRDEAYEERRRIAGAKLFNSLALSGKCSALVKVAADLSDIFMGHSTWDSYTAMLRIYKHYSFELRGLQPAAASMSFSSYPGEVFSDDDFFIMDSGLVVLQTTNKIFNDGLFEELSTRSVLSWQRIRAANWLATTGEEWARALEMRNSGTYNNQYMVVNLNKFVPGEDLRPGLLWVAEQIPGLVVAQDMTSVLALGYWPSYNVPFFPEVYEQSGYPDFIAKLEKYGQHFTKSTHWLSYEMSPRAKIFRRDQTTITSLDGMKAIMRSNNWKKDPLAEGRAVCAVCGRGDLDPEFPEARGCYDSKVTSYRLALRLEAEVVNGPTRDKGELAPFEWTKFTAQPKHPKSFNTSNSLSNDEELLHLGQPSKFDFKFERMVPAEPSSMGLCQRSFQSTDAMMA